MAMTHSSTRRPRLRMALAAVVALAPAPAAAQATNPSPAPPDSVVRQVIAAVQSGDPRVRGAFLSRALSPRARAADSARIDRLLAHMHGVGAPFHEIKREVGGRHVFLSLGSPRAGRALTMQISTERGAAAGLGTIGVLESHAAVLDTLQWPPGADPAAVIRDNLARLASRDAFTGVVYVLRGDSVLFARGYGLANREDSIANTLHTRFALASIGKMFTTTAILQLVDAGKLRVDDTLARVLPAYPSADRARRVTIRHLLEHSSGMGDLWSTQKIPVPGLTGQLAAAAEVAHAPLLFEPGARWSYSNEGYVVLAAVVEQVSGLPFHTYLERHVFAPAGMTETSLRGGPDDVVPHRAVGYRPQDGDALGTLPPRANWSFLRNEGASGAGGGYSTAADLARFGLALRSGRLVSPALRDSMWTGRWEIPGHAEERYGWGSFVRRVEGRVAVGHGGGGTGSGMDSNVRHFTDGSYTVVVLANADPPMSVRLTDGLARFLAAQPK